MPIIEIVDMKDVPKGVNLSPQLISEMAAAKNRKEQSMLFINRRGFASFVLCEECGTPLSCPNCNITFSYHKSDNCLMCHYCDTRIGEFSRCKKCGSRCLRMFGTGTEKIEDEIRGVFPDAVIERLDRDVTSKAGARSKVLSRMKLGEVDILIGTQMITKGHDFPNVSLVGVLDADLSLNFPDFRASERTFQIITQVAGRAGRSNSVGKVIIQTYMPGHYSIQSAKRHDFFDFCNNELPIRQELSYPPFGRIVLIKISGTNGLKVGKFSQYLVDNIKKENSLHILGPTEAPISRLRNKYRWQILLKSKDIEMLRRSTEAFIKLAERPPMGVKVAVDVDPINML
jgi:primosomal protein N' (replication factor Y)